MFKRLRSWLVSRRKGARKSAPPPPLAKYDLSQPFRIAIPVIVHVPLGPLETFSERAQKTILEEMAVLEKKTRNAIFHPMPDGTLRLFQPEEGVKETVN